MRPKSLVLLALALGCGSVAAVGINQVLANRDQQPAAPKGTTTPIVVAMADVEMGEPLTPANIKLEDWPKDKVPPDALAQVEGVDGRRTRTKIFAGEPIREVKLLSKDATAGSATDFIPKGYRVVAVKVDDVSGGSSLIKPGDRVDVLVHLRANPAMGIAETATRTILQDVKVFAVNEMFHRSSDPTEESIAARTISLLVTPDQSELVTLASEMGTIRLVMRSIEDDTVADTRGSTIQHLIGGAATGDRAAEEPGQTPQSGGGLLNLLNQPAAPTEEPSPVPTWRMRVIEGKDAREVEFGADGVSTHELPLAGKDAEGVTQTASSADAEPGTDATDESPATEPDDASNNAPDAP